MALGAGSELRLFANQATIHRCNEKDHQHINRYRSESYRCEQWAIHHHDQDVDRGEQEVQSVVIAVPVRKPRKLPVRSGAETVHQRAVLEEAQWQAQQLVDHLTAQQ